jgi:hypothetical protein
MPACVQCLKGMKEVASQAISTARDACFTTGGKHWQAASALGMYTCPPSCLLSALRCILSCRVLHAAGKQLFVIAAAEGWSTEPADQAVGRPRSTPARLACVDFGQTYDPSSQNVSLVMPTA